MRGINKVPKQLGAHRVAGEYTTDRRLHHHALTLPAIALYRALLSQCANLTIEQASITDLQNAIRNRFRVARPQRLRLALAFKSGYTALDLLDASVAGDDASTTRIKDLVARMPESLKQPPPPPKHLMPKVKNPAHYPPKEEHKLENMFPRPLGSVKGIRKAPFLVNAGGLPFIRWKKPQPKNVTRVIQTKIKTRQWRRDKLHEIDEVMLPMAHHEDRWDTLMFQLENREKGVEVSGQKRAKYVHAVENYRQELVDLYKQDDQRLRQMSRRFTDIVLKEQEYVKIEKKQRKAASKARRRLKKQSRKTDASQQTLDPKTDQD